MRNAFRKISGKWGALFPVMRRELNQIAARKSTYVLRSVYGALLALIGGAFVASVIRQAIRSVQMGYGGLMAYGCGDQLFYFLLAMAGVSIVALLPAMVVGSVTSERENGTLDLMRVSQLGPLEIVMQKFFARSVPFLSFLLLFVPLSAVAYGLGGLDVEDLVMGCLVLLVAVVRVVAISLLCSAWARTTVSAFLSAYLLLFVLYLIIPICAEIFDFMDDDWIAVWILGPWCPEASYIDDTAQVVGGIGLFMMLAGVLLLASRLMMRPRRAKMSLVKRLHGTYDRLLDRMNHLVGDVRWGKEHKLPEDKPIAWREKSRGSLCAPQHMFRLLLLIGIPTLLIIFAVALDGISGGDSEGLSVLLCILWLPMLLIPMVSVSNLISGERSGDSLEVLLTTPVRPTDIIRQKMAAIPRLLFFCTLSAWMIVGTRATFIRGSVSHYHQPPHGLAYFLVMALVLCVYPWLAVSIAFTCSLRIRKRALVVLASLVWFLGVVLLPALVAMLFAMADAEDVGEAIWWASPMGTFVLAEFMDAEDWREYLPIALTGLAFSAAIIATLWGYCFAKAEKLFKR